MIITYTCEVKSCSILDREGNWGAGSLWYLDLCNSKSCNLSWSFCHADEILEKDPPVQCGNLGTWWLILREGFFPIEARVFHFNISGLPSSITFAVWLLEKCGMFSQPSPFLWLQRLCDQNWSFYSFYTTNTKYYCGLQEFTKTYKVFLGRL